MNMIDNRMIDKFINLDEIQERQNKLLTFMNSSRKPIR